MMTAQATALPVIQPAIPARPQSGAETAKIVAVSKEYEQVFIAQFLGSMFASLPTDGITGGGTGEEMFRSLMTQQYAKSLSQRGGFGLANAIQAELIKHQQASP